MALHCGRRPDVGKMKATHVPSMVECSGSVKHCGYYNGQGQPWKSGRIIVYNRDGSWWCSIIYDCQNDKTAASVRLKKDVIKKIVCKNRLLLEFTDGQTFILTKAESDRRLHELNDFLVELSDGRIDLTSPGKPAKALRENVVTSPAGLQNVEIKEFVTSSPQPFTRVKEPKSKAGWEPSLFSDAWEQEEVEKENTSAHKPQPLDFLHRGSEKSRETLKTIGASGFYSNKSQTPYHDRPYGPFASYSSSKRTPGLMPDPTPNKRPRLSNVPYSWSKNKTTSHSDSKTQSALQGFSNLGNTCYMNAILQALFGLETFATDVLTTNRRLLRSLSRDSLYHNLARLLSAKKKTNVADGVRRDLLRSVKSAISSSAKRFSGYQQHDAHEFLGQVLDQLKEEVVKLNKATPSPSKECFTGEINLSGQEYVNPTIQNFEFEVLHTIKCTECGETVTKTEQFNDLSLDLPRKYDVDNPETIQDALDSFLRKEEIEYKCSECNGQQSEVYHSFTRLPRVLILHLKRYVYTIASCGNKKMGQNIFIPRYLTLQSQCDEETQPPFPPVLCTVQQSSHDSPVKSVIDVDADKTDITRRKLDYNNSGNRFNGTFRRIRSTEVDQEDSDDQRWITLKKKPKIEEVDNVREPGDDELVHALELSLQGTDMEDKSTETVPEPEPEREEGELTEDQQLQKVLEMSRLEATGDNTMDMSDLRLENMTDEEMLRLALERSMMESSNQQADCNSPKHQSDTRKCSAEVNSTLKGGWSKPLSDTELDHPYDSSPSGSRRSPTRRKRRVSHTITQDPQNVIEISEDDSDNGAKQGKIASPAAASTSKKTPQHRQEPLQPDGESEDDKQSETESATVENNGSGDHVIRIESSGEFSPEEEVVLITGVTVGAPGGDNCDEVDGGRLPVNTKTSSSCTQTDAEFLSCQENDEDLEDKENKTPPKNSPTVKFKKDPNWITDATNKDAHDVISFGLDEEDEDIRRAKELSLQELDSQQDQLSFEEAPHVEPPHIVRSKEETETLKKHFENGHLPYAYRLVSVVSHIGSSSSMGHYVSDVYDFKKGGWYSYDDSHVSKTSEADVRLRRERTGYIFFYMCKDINEDLVTNSRLEQVRRKQSIDS